MTDQHEEIAETKPPKPLWLRLAPVAILLAATIGVFATGLDRHLSFAALRDNREAMLAWVDEVGWVAALSYMGLYAGVVALSVPGALFLSLAGGFVFGAFAATGYTVIGATVGATVVFLIAANALGDSLRKRAGPALQRMESGFRDNALSYLLVLRLIPLFPFWLVNLVPALLGVPLGTFVIATFFGIIPGTAVFCLAGAGLGGGFDAGEEFSLANILTGETIGALVGLAILALLPIAYKRWRRKGGRA